MTGPAVKLSLTSLLALQLIACETGYPYWTIPVQFANTETVINRGGYYLTDVFASVDIETAATEIRVTTYNTIYGSYPGLTRVGVYVDGAFLQEINPGESGENSNTIYLSAGTKTVSFINGPQSRPNINNDPLGTFIVSLEADAAMTQVGADVSPSVLVYGDSIAVGDGATTVMENAWIMQVRAGMTVGAAAWGWRTLYEDASTTEKRAVFVQSIEDWGASTIWLAIGTNDYGLNKWTAAEFGAAYAQLIDDIHTALPSVEIYCQSPLVRSSEAANGKGSTLGDYRSQISTACSTRAWANYIDGESILLVADLADGVHPSSAGHTKYADYVSGVLGE